MADVTPEIWAHTTHWMRDFHDYWHLEMPVRIHSRETDYGGAPEWHHDFERWLTRGDPGDDQKWVRNPEPRVRTTRAFRKLRKWHVREFEVLYRVCILGHTITSTARWLNERAARNEKPERYTEEDVRLILVVATDKVANWF